MNACMGMNLSRWDVACAQKVGMKNKVCGPKGTCIRAKTGRGMRNKVYGPKDTYMRMKLDVVCARKNFMKNKVCGPEGCLRKNERGSTGRSMNSKSWYEK